MDSPSMDDFLLQNGYTLLVYPSITEFQYQTWSKTIRNLYTIHINRPSNTELNAYFIIYFTQPHDAFYRITLPFDISSIILIEQRAKDIYVRYS